MPCEDHSVFTTTPVLVGRYGVHGIMKFKSQGDLHRHLQAAVRQNDLFRAAMDYPTKRNRMTRR